MRNIPPREPIVKSGPPDHNDLASVAAAIRRTHARAARENATELAMFDSLLYALGVAEPEHVGALRALWKASEGGAHSSLFNADVARAAEWSERTVRLHLQPALDALTYPAMRKTKRGSKWAGATRYDFGFMVEAVGRMEVERPVSARACHPLARVVLTAMFAERGIDVELVPVPQPAPAGDDDDQAPGPKPQRRTFGERIAAEIEKRGPEAFAKALAAALDPEGLARLTAGFVREAADLGALARVAELATEDPSAGWGDPDRIAGRHEEGIAGGGLQSERDLNRQDLPVDSPPAGSNDADLQPFDPVAAALEAVDLFAGAGCLSFDWKLLDDRAKAAGEEGEIRGLGRRLGAEAFKKALPALIRASHREGWSLLGRPRGPVAQFDDAPEGASVPGTFVEVVTSAEGRQLWAAIEGVDERGARRIGRAVSAAIGADGSASGEVRWPGSVSGKPNRAGFVVRFHALEGARPTTVGELRGAGLLPPEEAPRPPRRDPSPRPAADPSRRGWPSWDRCLADKGGDTFAADAQWCVIALDRGWSRGDVEVELLRVRRSHGRKAGARYAADTVAGALEHMAQQGAAAGVSS